MRLSDMPKDARYLLAGKGLRAFADGLASIVLPTYLLKLGFSAFSIGVIITSTLVGSACLTLTVGFLAHRYSRRRIIWLTCLLMIATGICFALFSDFWLLVIVAFIGTLNPSAGDVSLFLPMEQAMMAERATSSNRTALFAWYSLVGSLVGALGTLSASLPEVSARHLGVDQLTTLRGAFLLYAALGAGALFFYRALTPSVEGGLPAPTTKALGPSKHIVYRLAALFSVDAFGGGFFVQSLLTLWLYEAFGLSTVTAATILFWAGVLAAISYLVAVPLARQIGLINTMVFTHLPSNIFLILIPFSPNLAVAIGLLLLRSALSQMDVPARTSYVLAVVTPQERPAAASVTAVPRSLASAVSPMIAGYLLAVSSFGWPLIVGGLLKGAYDIALLLMFRRIRPRDEAVAR